MKNKLCWCGHPKESHKEYLSLSLDYNIDNYVVKKYIKCQHCVCSLFKEMKK